MDNIAIEEMAWFISELQRSKGDYQPALATFPSLAKLPLREYEKELLEIKPQLPMSGAYLAIIYPQDRYSIRFYQIYGNETASVIPFERRRIRKLTPTLRGFPASDVSTARSQYSNDPRSRLSLDKQMVTVTAAAVYWGLKDHVDAVYFMVKGWTNAYRLNGG